MYVVFFVRGWTEHLSCSQAEHDAVRRSLENELTSLRAEVLRLEAQHSLEISSISQRHNSELAAAHRELAEVQHAAVMSSQAAAASAEQDKFVLESTVNQLRFELDSLRGQHQDVVSQLSVSERTLADLRASTRQDADTKAAQVHLRALANVALPFSVSKRVMFLFAGTIGS